MTAKKKVTTPPAKTTRRPDKKPAGKPLANTDLPADTQKAATPPKAVATPALLLSDVRELILTTRQTVAQGINSALTTLYWEVGWRIWQDVLKSKRAGYGEQVVAALGDNWSGTLGAASASGICFA